MHETPISQRITYLRGLLQNYGTLSLPLGSGLSFALVRVFQPLRLRQSNADKTSTPKADPQERQSDPREDANESHDPEEDEKRPEILAENGIEALNKSPHARVVILGSPGMGKTSLLKHILYRFAQQALEESAAPLPIFLSLPELARMGQNLEAYLVQIARDLGMEANYGRTLLQSIQQGHALVYLDSLDEVLPRERAGIIRQINELARISGNHWVVGSRFTDYKGGQFQSGQFQEWELQSLDPERRRELAEHLLPELQRQLAPANQSLQPSEYVQALSEHRQAASWGANPLLFSLGAVAYLRRGHLSGSQAMLYREVVDALLETRGGDANLRSILAEVALELYQIKGRTFSLAEMQAVLTKLNIKQRATWNVAKMGYRVLNSGLLDVVATETYSFRHQTFQEYLAASALASRFMSQDGQIGEAARQLAWSKHTYSRWNEIERLLLGVLMQEYGEPGVLQAQAWLTRLLQQRESIVGDPGNLSLELALKALGEVAQLEEWQRAETLELEEMAASAWSKEVRDLVEDEARRRGNRQYNRYVTMATEIGHLRPGPQQRAIETLLKSLIEGNHYQLDKIIGAIRSNVATQFLLDALERVPRSDDRHHIISILGYMGEFAPIDFLLDELRSQDSSSRSSAQNALVQLALYVPAEKIVPLLYLDISGLPQAAKAILCAIAHVKELPLQELLDALRKRGTAAAMAAFVLAEAQHPAAIDVLLRLMNNLLKRKQSTDIPFHRYWPLIRSVLKALGHYKTLAPFDQVTALLEIKDAFVRMPTLDALATYGLVVPMEVLVQVASDPAIGVREGAIRTLGKLGDQAPLEVLIQAMSDTSRLVICAAIEVLGAHAPLELLFDFLQQERLQGAALEALSHKELAGQVPIERLLALYEQDWEIHQEVLAVLINAGYPLTQTLLVNEICNEGGKYGYTEAKELLGSKAATQLIAEQLDAVEARCYPPFTRAIAVLGGWQVQRAADALLQALADERRRVSEAAARQLSQRADEIALADLLALLKHKYGWVRSNALQVLAECSTAPPLEPLIEALHDRRSFIRAMAARALRTQGENAPLAELVAATLDDNLGVRKEAAVTLGKVGKRNPALVVDGVINLLQLDVKFDYGVPWEGCKPATEALAEISPSMPVERLLQVFYTSNSFEIIDFVAEVLGQLGERTPIEQLTQALQDQNVHIRQAAANALSMTGERAPVAALIEAFNRNDPEDQSVLVKALTKVSEHGHVPDEIFLEQIFKKGDYKTYLPLFEAFTAQKKHIPEAILVEALEHFSYEDASKIILYLNQLPEQLSNLPEKLVARALSLYETSQYRNNTNTANKIIAHLVPKLSVSSLLEAVTHRNSKVRFGALGLLAKYPGVVPLEPILSRLLDPEADVRKAAISSLQKWPDKAPVQSIIACLQDPNTSVCESAIKTLASLGSQAPLSEISAMLEHPAGQVRRAVAQVLAQPDNWERVPTEVLVSALEEDESEPYYRYRRVNLLDVLCRKDPRLATEYCLAALGDSDERLSLAAFQHLKELQPKSIPEILQEATMLAQGRQPGRFFRTLSLGYLADMIGEVEQATPDLMARLGELLEWPYWQVRAKAARALGKLRRNVPDSAIRQLLELRHDPHSRAVREAADEALAEILSLETGIEDD